MPRNRNGLIVFVWLLNLCCYGVFAGMQRRPLTPELSATLPTGPHSPTQSVNNCPKQLIPIPLNDVQLQQLSDGLLPLLKAKFASMVPPNAAPGVSVAVTYRDKPLLYFSAGVKDVDSNQPVSPQTLFQCGSVSKSFTSALAHVAIENGSLMSLDDKIVQYVPEFSVINPFTTLSDASTTTFRQLASHLAGLPRETPCQFALCNVTTDMVIKSLKEMYLIRPPNSYPSYSNLGFSLFGHLVAEKAMRSTFYDAIQRYVLDPLRMTSSGFFYDAQVVEKLARGHQWYNGMFYALPITDPLWNAPTGSLYSNAVDLANAMIGLLHRNASAPLFKTDAVWNEFLLPVYWNADSKTGIGASWEITHRGNYYNPEKSGSLGGSLSVISLIPQLELGVAVMVNGPYSPSMYTDAVYDYLLPQLETLLSLQQPPFDTPANATVYVGKYALAGSSVSFATISYASGVLMFVADIIPNRVALVKPPLSSTLRNSPNVLQVSLPPDLIPCLYGELLGYDQQYVFFQLGQDGKAASFSVPGMAFGLSWVRIQ